MTIMTREMLDELEVRKSAYPMDIERILDRDHYYALLVLAENGLEAESVSAQLTASCEENTRLRAALATSKDPCVYCQLSYEDMGECRAGFPGCARADDLVGCPEFGAMMTNQLMTEELTAAREEIAKLRDALEVVKRAAIGGSSYQAFKDIANNALAETEPKL